MKLVQWGFNHSAFDRGPCLVLSRGPSIREQTGARQPVRLGIRRSCKYYDTHGMTSGSVYSVYNPEHLHQIRLNQSVPRSRHHLMSCTDGLELPDLEQAPWAVVAPQEIRWSSTCGNIISITQQTRSRDPLIHAD